MVAVSLRKLAPVPHGAHIAVLSPASFANDDRVTRGLDHLRSLGFASVPGAHTQARGPLFFAGSPQDRLADLHAAFDDNGTRILAAVRGGYGSNYLLDGLDLGRIAAHPKPFFAYSDLTGLQLYLLDRLGLPVFHGPMVAADFSREDGVHLPSFQSALAGKPYSVGAAEGLRMLKPGTARGTLYGGCLSILVAMLGTPWTPTLEDKLLFVEDVGVKPYQIDRMLWQLRAAGKLEGLRGIVFGEMLHCTSPGAPASLLDDVILHFFRDLDIPIAIGLRSGHVSRANVTLTLGAAAELHATADPHLDLVEPVIQS
ncbi:MAG TPA: LD-carboxypeptidase [Terracidiphilus sp.]|nr:LD-carboxypeptidase [Terracidiphilus sp.]